MLPAACGLLCSDTGFYSIQIAGAESGLDTGHARDMLDTLELEQVEELYYIPCTQSDSECCVQS